MSYKDISIKQSVSYYFTLLLILLFCLETRHNSEMRSNGANYFAFEVSVYKETDSEGSNIV